MIVHVYINHNIVLFQIIFSRLTIQHGKDKKRTAMKFERYQYPVRSCFAMTVNRSQGQTLKRMGLALDRQQCFSHGQVYVALSRVTRMDGIKVYSTTSSQPNRIRNFVYQPILEEEDRYFFDTNATNIQRKVFDQLNLPQPILKPPPSPTLNVPELDMDYEDDEQLDPVKNVTKRKKTPPAIDVEEDADILFEQEFQHELNQLPFVPPEERTAKIKNVSADGNCFFRAICHALYRNQARHKKLRKDMIENLRILLRDNPLEVEWLRLHLQPQDNNDFDKYMERMKDPATDENGREKWAGEVEAVLCAKLLRRQIITVYPSFGKTLARVYEPDKDSLINMTHYEVTDNVYNSLFNIHPGAIVIYYNGIDHYQTIEDR